MTMGQRWVEVTKSPFTHEQEGLQQIRDLLPDQPPFRAWSNVEFRDGSGKWSEVDLLVLGRRNLHLVELKHYAGMLRGNDVTWTRGGRTEDSPLKLARRKAQRLSSRLKDELRAKCQAEGRPFDPSVLPYVQECVYLHHHTFRSQLPRASERDLFAPSGRQNSTNLPSIAERLLEPGQPHPATERTVVELLEGIGLVQRRQREVGSFLIDDEPMADGDGFQDWPASHKVVTTDRYRIRFFVSRPGSTTAEAAKVKQAVRREYQVTSRLHHDGLLRPQDLVDDELGPGLVYPADERYRRLDLWLADHPYGLPVQTTLSVVRQIAEAVSYAHRHRVVHRGLTPAAVQVRDLPDGRARSQIGDWQAVGLLDDSAKMTGLTGVSESSARLLAVLHGPDDEAGRGQVYLAPEGLRATDRVRLDVFGIGALAYLLLSGRPPALSRTAQRARLEQDGGFDLAVDLPQVSPAMRTLVKRATAIRVSDRPADAAELLELLAAAEREAAGPAEDELDPLDAAPGTVLGGRFEVLRSLGSGSTATGLLVRDNARTGPDAERVLKVARDDEAKGRLAEEAAVLTGLPTHPRLVRLLDGPLTVGTRSALLLSSAGERTLAESLRARVRLSIDRLERWGGDLLEAAVALEDAGVFHRDIKPANLGVLEGRSDRQKHLVLFDFSLSRAAASAVTAGTTHYLDPFVESRGSYDSAAERYAVAVVLLEMASGQLPVFGDGASDPALIPDEAHLEPAQFDPAVAEPLVNFFRTALARTVSERYDTARQMQAAWLEVFGRVPSTRHEGADELAVAAQPVTTLRAAGLSARAISALEPFAVQTAGDLAALDPVRLNAFSGVAEATRREVKERATQWRNRFATAPAADDATPEAARTLLAATPPAVRGLVRLVLGLDGAVDAHATPAQLSKASGVKRAKVADRLVTAQNAWAGAPAAAALLDDVERLGRAALAEVEDVATPAELAAVVAERAPEHGGRLAAGLLALALDRDPTDQALPVQARRAEGAVVLLSTSAALLDQAEAAGRLVDTLVSDELVLATTAAADRLRAVVLSGLSDDRLVAVAAARSTRTVLSGRGELHSRDLPAAVALRLAVSGLAPSVLLAPSELRSRVRARFPALAPLPERPQLDAVVQASGLDLVFDEVATAYRARLAVVATDLESRLVTSLYVGRAPIADVLGQTDVRLRASMASRSFLALGVRMDRPDRSDQAADLLAARHGATIVDVTGELVEAMRNVAVSMRLPWDQVLAADAAAAGSREHQGLTALVSRCLPAVEAVVDAALGRGPVVLTELSPLAQYGHLGLLTRWTDLTAPRAAAVWALLPQMQGQVGAVADGKPLPLAAPGQFLVLDDAWFKEAAVRRG